MKGPGILSRAADVVRRALGYGDGWAVVRGQEPSQYQRTGRNARVLGWERHPTVNACGRVIADQFGAVPLKVYKQDKTGDLEEVEPGHPLQRLFDRPRVNMPAAYWRSLQGLQYALYGNGFNILERGAATRKTGPVSALRLVHPEDLVYLWLDAKDLEPDRVDWRNRAGVVQSSPPEDLVHVRDLTGADWLFGYPRAAAALTEFLADNEASEYVRQVLTNDGYAATVVLVDNDTTDKDARAAEERLHERMAKRGGRGRTVFLGGVKDVKPVGFNLRDLEFPDARAVNREGICSAFGVDPRIVGAGSAKGSDGGLSGQQYQEARFRLFHQTVLPAFVAMESVFDAQICSEFGEDLVVRFDRDAIADLVESMAQRSERLRAEYASRLITLEEARRGLRRPEAMPEEEHVAGSLSQFYETVRVATITADVEPPPPPDPNALPPGGDPNVLPPGDPKPADDDATKAAAKQAEEDKARAGASPATRLRVGPRCRGVKLSTKARAALWDMFDVRAERAGVPYRRAALMLFAAERSSVLGLFDSAAKLAGRSLTDVSRRVDPEEDRYIREALRRALEDYAPGGEYHEAWERRYRALIGQTVTDSAGGLAADLGVKMDLESPTVLDAVARRALDLAKLVTDVSAADLEAAVTAGLAQGMGTREVAALISETVYGDNMTASRATRIARTESVGALNEGEFVAAYTTGVIQSKEWLSQGDERVRDTDEASHVALDGTRVAMSEPFVGVAGAQLMYPGDRDGGPAETINCRCTLLFYDE